MNSIEGGIQGLKQQIEKFQRVVKSNEKNLREVEEEEKEGVFLSSGELCVVCMFHVYGCFPHHTCNS